MIVFQQNHVEQPDTMIYATANLYCHLFKDTHTGSCLTGIQYAGMSAFKFLRVFACHGRDTAHALHHVQHQAFGLKQGLHLTFHQIGRAHV